MTVIFIFHHRNPEEKKFGLSVNNLWSTKWDIILEEFNKCDMLCANCHALVEHEIAQLKKHKKGEEYYYHPNKT